MSPILDQNSLEIISRSAEQTRRVGMRLGSLLQSGYVVSLEGDLGAGKTTLVQGMAAGWGSLDPVLSPTFVLVNVYGRGDKNRFYHLDAYRLNSPDEVLHLDIEGMLYEGILVVEWADRIETALPKECLWASLRWIDETQRDLVFSARGTLYQGLLLKFREKVYGVS